MTQSNHDDVLTSMKAWLKLDKKFAQATVIDTWGSSPRPVGSQLIIDETGNFLGSVSGGCVEGAVVTESLSSIKDGRCRILEYGVSNETAFAVGLSCGGNIRILVEPVGFGQGPSYSFIEKVLAYHEKRYLFGYAVDLSAWRRELFLVIDDDDRELIFGCKIPSTTKVCGDNLFFSIVKPNLKLVVVGAVHIAQSLISIAKLIGYQVILIDPRSSFAWEVDGKRAWRL